MEYLAEAEHPVTKQVYTFGNIEAELDLGFTRQSGLYTALDRDGGIDGLGGNGGGIDPRQLTATFMHIYTPGETFSDAKNALLKIVGHGVRQKLVKIDSNGVRHVGYGKAVGYPIKAARDQMFAAVFVVTFEMDDPLWYAEAPPGSLFWDAPGATWDDPTRLWDVNTDDFALGTANVFHTLTHNGTAPLYDFRVTVRGPFPGPIVIYNTTITINGHPMFVGTLDGVAAGESVVFDMGGWSLTKQGQPAFANLVLAGDQEDWLRIDPGTNVIQIQSQGVGAYTGTCFIDWRPTFY